MKQDLPWPDRHDSTAAAFARLGLAVRHLGGALHDTAPGRWLDRLALRIATWLD